MACMLVCLDFIHTLEIIARMLSEVVNRERLCDTSVIWWVASAIFGGSNPLQKYRHNRLFACSLEFHRTLKIIARTLSEVVNRERLCGTNAV